MIRRARTVNACPDSLLITITPSPAGGWSLLEVLPGGEQDAAEFTAGTTDVLTFREFNDAAEMCQRLNAYYLPSSPSAVVADQCVG